MHAARPSAVSTKRGSTTTACITVAYYRCGSDLRYADQHKCGRMPPRVVVYASPLGENGNAGAVGGPHATVRPGTYFRFPQIGSPTRARTSANRSNERNTSS